MLEQLRADFAGLPKLLSERLPGEEPPAPEPEPEPEPALAAAGAAADLPPPDQLGLF
jgi:hypothetical protein